MLGFAEERDDPEEDHRTENPQIAQHERRDEPARHDDLRIGDISPHVTLASSIEPWPFQDTFSIMKAVHDAAAAVIPTGTRPGRR